MCADVGTRTDLVPNEPPSSGSAVVGSLIHLARPTRVVAMGHREVLGGLGVLFSALLIAPNAVAAPAPGDFNDDGRSDLAIGAPFEDVATDDSAGAVNVLYGGRHGLRKRGDQFLHRGRKGIAGGGTEPSADFGSALASGDFDGDGRDDLAVGVPGEGGGAFTGPGAVNVLYGTKRGLSREGDRLFSQNTKGMAGDGAQGGDLFGYALAAGDFDRDGRDDLAIGAPFETLANALDQEQGAVTVLYGTRRGLRTKGSQFLHQDKPGMAGDGAEDEDRFGEVLTVGDFDADRRDDLAVGIRNEGIASGGNADDGAVNVIYGTRRGLRTRGSRFLHQDSPGMAGDGAEGDDNFGDSLAAADFDRDGDDDLGIGAGDECITSGLDQLCDAGAVSVVYGSPKGLTTTGSQFWHQGQPGVAGDGLEVDDRFGETLVVGDFDGDRRGDLAVGLRAEDVVAGGNDTDGAVNVLYGTRQGLTANGSQFVHQGMLAGEQAEVNDEFGDALGAGNFDRNGRTDLAVGVPLEDVTAGGNLDDGAVDVIYGGRFGLRPGRSQALNQSRPGIADVSEQSDFFGAALAPPDGRILPNVFD